MGRPKTFDVCNVATGQVITITNLTTYCKDNCLSEAGMRDVSKHRQTQHRGWLCRVTGDNSIDFEAVRSKLLHVPQHKQRVSKQQRYKRSDQYVHFLSDVPGYYQTLYIDQHLSCRQIGIKFGISTSKVENAFKSAGLRKTNKWNHAVKGTDHFTFKAYNDAQKRLYNDFVNIFTDLHHQQSLSVAAIANQYGVCKTTIFNYCRMHGIDYRRSNISSQHEALVQWLQKHNVILSINDRSIIPPKELDIFIPSCNVAIEINGLFWHDEQRLGRSYHCEKHNLCKDVSIDLLQFYDVEVDNKIDIVKSIVANRLGIGERRTIGGRQTMIKQVQFRDIGQFLDDNHIQGKRTSGINLTLVDHDQQIVAVATFNHHSKYQFELIRLCTKLGTNVVGGATKLLNHFEQHYKPTSLVSYCDKRLFTGNVYKQLGFSYVGDSAPNYHYFSSTLGGQYKLQSRIKFQKHKLRRLLSTFDDSLSEVDNMKKAGYSRIFDAGNKIFLKQYGSKQ